MCQTSFSISVSSEQTAAVVCTQGEVDLATAPNVESAIEECIQAGFATIEVDMSGTTFMSCAGINAVIAGRIHGSAVGSTVAIVRPSRAVTRVLELGRAMPLVADATAPGGPHDALPIPTSPLSVDIPAEVATEVSVPAPTRPAPEELVAD